MRLRRLFLFSLLSLFVFILAPSAQAGGKYRVLYNFYGNYGVGGPNGGPPLATPVLDASGNLYGPAGGCTGNSSQCDGPCGVVFKMTRRANGKWSESVALNFSTYFNEGVPDSPLVFDSRGNLYGSNTLANDPADNWVYQLTPGSSGWGFNLIYQSYGPDVGGVTPDGAGNLYGELGVESDYHTAVGELSPGSSGWVYTDLYTFCENGGNCPDGALPRAPFSWDTKGNLYGADYGGGLSCPGSYGCGVAFQMTRNVYGTTFKGGPHATGTVFKLTQTSGGAWRETLVYAFPDVSLGAYPWGNLVFDKAGNLYGVANGGDSCGAYLCGEVFKLTPQKNGKWRYSVVHGFKGPEGAYPYGVVIDGKGNLFGTTLGGGTYGYGVVYELTP